MTGASTVFVVDDDAGFRRAVATLLAEVKLPVGEFETANAFLEFYDDQPGCVVLDVRMPGMSGIELHETLNARGVSIPVVLVSGHGDISMAVKAVQRGALDFIEKPFDPQVLVDRIQSALTRDAEIRRDAQHRREIKTRLSRLTPREHEVVTLLMAGHSVKKIAERLGLSYKTVNNHRASILKKTDAKSLIELAHLTAGLAERQHSFVTPR